MAIHSEHPILKKLSDLPIVFYPTGSRFLGHERPHSDYDFFVECDYSEKDGIPAYGDLKKQLGELGFQTVERGGYLPDDELRLMMRWDDPDSQHASIDILGGTPGVIALRRRVFDALKEIDSTITFGDGVQQLCLSIKSSASQWRVLYRLFKMAEEGDKEEK